jgi:hypothetical protein
MAERDYETRGNWQSLNKGPERVPAPAPEPAPEPEPEPEPAPEPEPEVEDDDDPLDLAFDEEDGIE